MKIGWVCASPALLDAVATTKQFLTYVNGAPFQDAVVAGLALPDARIEAIRTNLRGRRDSCATVCWRQGWTCTRVRPPTS